MSRLPARMPRPGANAANVWPGMTAATAAQFTRIGRGLPISKPNQFAQIHVRYYHQQTYAAAGQNQLTFFQVNASQGICNLNNGVTPDERPFWLTGICVSYQFLTAGGAASTLQPYSTGVLGGVGYNEINQALQGGLLQLYVGDRLVHEGQDLTKYPSDGGTWTAPATNSATTASITPINNGMPVAGNRFKFPAPYPILPGKPITVFLRWLAAVAITGATAGRIKVELCGESIMPLNA